MYVSLTSCYKCKITSHYKNKIIILIMLILIESGILSYHYLKACSHGFLVCSTTSCTISTMYVYCYSQDSLKPHHHKNATLSIFTTILHQRVAMRIENTCSFLDLAISHFGSLSDCLIILCTEHNKCFNNLGIKATLSCVIKWGSNRTIENQRSFQ